MANPNNYVEIARRVIQERAAKCESTPLHRAAGDSPESLEEAFRGQAIELWSTAAGKLFVAANPRELDEPGARLAYRPIATTERDDRGIYPRLLLDQR